MTTYHLREPRHEPWREVTKAEYVAAERRAGFRNTLGQPDEPATSAFSGNGVDGCIGALLPAEPAS